MYRNIERNIYGLMLTILFTVWLAPCIAFAGILKEQKLRSDSIPNVFLKIVPSKAKVYVGEPFTVQYLLYYAIPIIDPQNELSIKFKNCDVEEYPSDTGSTTKKIISGKLFHIIVLKKLLVIAALPARLHIPPISINLQSNAPAEASDFFGTEQTVKQKISSAPQTIEVLALPNSTGDTPFSGAVGSFKIVINYIKSLTAPNTLVVTVEVDGIGNLKFSKVTIPRLPQGVEAFNTTDNQTHTLTNDGVNAHQTFRFNLVSNYKADFVIPPFSFSYFDPQQAKYVVVNSPGYNFQTTTGQPLATIATIAANGVAAKAGGANNTGKLFFYNNATNEHLGNKWFPGPRIALLLIGASSLLFLIGLVYRYTIAKNKQDTVQINNQRAFKTAAYNIKKLNRRSENLDNEHFYKSLCGILKTYLCAKNHTDLLRFADINPSETLAKHHVPQDIYNRTIVFLNTEHIRFLPHKKEFLSKDVSCATLLQIINALDHHLND
jgi:hypothetical protein